MRILQRLPPEKRKCKKCGTTENLTVHHLKRGTIKTWGRTGAWIILCRDCHDKVHGIKHKEKPKDWLTEIREEIGA